MKRIKKQRKRNTAKKVFRLFAHFFWPRLLSHIFYTFLVFFSTLSAFFSPAQRNIIFKKQHRQNQMSMRVFSRPGEVRERSAWKRAGEMRFLPRFDCFIACCKRNTLCDEANPFIHKRSRKINRFPAAPTAIIVPNACGEKESSLSTKSCLVFLLAAAAAASSSTSTCSSAQLPTAK